MQDPTPIAVTLTPEDREEIAQRVAELLREPEEDRWLDTAEASRYSGKHRDTLTRLFREGRLEGQQDTPRAKIFFRESALRFCFLPCFLRLCQAGLRHDPSL